MLASINNHLYLNCNVNECVTKDGFEDISLMIVKTCVSKEVVTLEVEKRPTERQEDDKGKWQTTKQKTDKTGA